MKKQILFFLLFISTLAYSQNTEFKLNTEGFTDYIVTQVPGKSTSELYTKALEWTTKTYKNPEKVIVGKIENDYIKIEGFQSNLYCLKVGCQDGMYQLEISFKDGKYKFQVSELKQQISGFGWTPTDFNKNKSFYFDSNGLKKKFEMYKSIPEYFNKLNKSLFDYISDVNIESKDNW